MKNKLITGMIVILLLPCSAGLTLNYSGRIITEYRMTEQGNNSTYALDEQYHADLVQTINPYVKAGATLRLLRQSNDRSRTHYSMIQPILDIRKSDRYYNYSAGYQEIQLRTKNQIGTTRRNLFSTLLVTSPVLPRLVFRYDEIQSLDNLNQKILNKKNRQVSAEASYNLPFANISYYLLRTTDEDKINRPEVQNVSLVKTLRATLNYQFRIVPRITSAINYALNGDQNWQNSVLTQNRTQHFIRVTNLWTPVKNLRVTHSYDLNLQRDLINKYTVRDEQHNINLTATPYRGINLGNTLKLYKLTGGSSPQKTSDYNFYINTALSRYADVRFNGKYYKGGNPATSALNEHQSSNDLFFTIKPYTGVTFETQLSKLEKSFPTTSESALEETNRRRFTLTARLKDNKTWTTYYDKYISNLTGILKTFNSQLTTFYKRYNLRFTRTLYWEIGKSTEKYINADIFWRYLNFIYLRATLSKYFTGSSRDFQFPVELNLYFTYDKKFDIIPRYVNNNALKGTDEASIEIRSSRIPDKKLSFFYRLKHPRGRKTGSDDHFFKTSLLLTF